MKGLCPLFFEGEEKEESKRGEASLPNNSPSPLKERGTQGVR
jgi:hypothetical protein